MKTPKVKKMDDEHVADEIVEVFTAQPAFGSGQNTERLIEQELVRARVLADKWDKKVNGVATWVAILVVFFVSILTIVAAGLAVAWVFSKLF